MQVGSSRMSTSRGALVTSILYLACGDGSMSSGFGADGGAGADDGGTTVTAFGDGGSTRDGGPPGTLAAVIRNPLTRGV